VLSMKFLLGLGAASYRVCVQLNRQAYRYPLYSAQCSIHSGLPLKHWLDARNPNKEKEEADLVVRHEKEFNKIADIKKRNRETFKLAVEKFSKRGDVYKRGHCEFIYASLKQMKEFGVHKDLDMYKAILDAFPKEKMVVKTVWQAEFMHYPKQQQCCIDILCQLEDNGIVPDDEMGYQLIAIFGKKSHAFRKYQRIMYWMPKFKNLSPYPIPQELPLDPREVAALALSRMAVDEQNRVDVFETVELEDYVDETWVASAQAPDQITLLSQCKLDVPVFVEGPYETWLRDVCMFYFILRSDVSKGYEMYLKSLEDKEKNKFELNGKAFNLFGHMDPEGAVVKRPTDHEQSDGTVLAMCITGTSSKESLVSWISLLQRTNPHLAQLPVVFQYRHRASEEIGDLIAESSKPMDFPALPGGQYKAWN